MAQRFASVSEDELCEKCTLTNYRYWIIIKTSCLYYLPQPSASADNTDLGFDNSWYHAQPHPIIVYYYLPQQHSPHYQIHGFTIAYGKFILIHDIMRKPNSIIVLLYIFHIIHPQKQKRSIQPFCFSKGVSNQADVELDMINAISAADIAFIMSSSQAIVNWLNALDQSDFS